MELALPVGLGTNTFGRTTDAETSRDVLDAFVAAGGTLVDTADTYSDGESERIIGQWMRERANRDQVVLVSKGGNHADFDGLAVSTITGACEASLRRLGTDRIDLYFAHYQDDQTPVEESAAAFDTLVRSGKIRSYGLSNFSPEAVGEWIDTARTHGHALPVALQPHYSLVHRRTFETGLDDIARDAGLAVLPYRALGGGFLSGKYRTAADTEGRPRGAGVRPLLTPAGLALLAVVESVAAAHQVSPAAVAVAWLLSRPEVTAPLVSATSKAQLAEVVRGADLVLDETELARLAEASAPLEA